MTCSTWLRSTMTTSRPPPPRCTGSRRSTCSVSRGTTITWYSCSIWVGWHRATSGSRSPRARERWRVRVSDPVLAALQARCADLERRLAEAGPGRRDGTSREALKTEIIALYRAIDQELASLGALKERVRGLV